MYRFLMVMSLLHPCFGLADVLSTALSEYAEMNATCGSPSNSFLSKYPRTCIEHDGLNRCWFSFVPDSATASSAPVPLVVDMHGYTGCAESNPYYTGWKEKAEENGFVVVWPQGTQNLPEARDASPSWHAGAACCGGAAEKKIDDVGFLRKVVDNSASTLNIDRFRVYMAGHSNGCAMAQRMAVQASDMVAAVACHAMYLVATPSVDFAPVAVMEIHGTSDSVVPYDSGWGGAVDNFEEWRDLNECQGSPIETTNDGYTQHAYTNCAQGTEVELITLAGVGHSPYQGGGGTAVDTTQLAWEFVQRFSKGKDDTSPPSPTSPKPTPAPTATSPKPTSSPTAPCEICISTTLQPSVEAGVTSDGAYTCLQAQDWLNSPDTYMTCALGRTYWAATCCIEATTTPALTPAPTPAPTPSPTPAPTQKPTLAPTPTPTSAPTPSPTSAPSAKATLAPTPTPTSAPTPSPTSAPTAKPTQKPSSGYHRVRKGRVQGRCKEVGGDCNARCESDVGVYAVRCCSDVSIAGWSVRDGVWHESNAWETCERLPFAAARDFCSAQGGRLCTDDEVGRDLVRGTGCGFDAYLIWTSDECTPTSLIASRSARHSQKRQRSFKPGFLERNMENNLLQLTRAVRSSRNEL